MECQKTTDQTAFPVFYDVEPTEVRKQTGPVGEAFAKHTKKVIVGKTLTTTVRKALAKHSKKKLGKWRKALKDAANLCGWELKNTAHGHEAKVIKLIVERISLELRSINMGVDENLIAIEPRMQAIDTSLDIGVHDVRMIGIKGMGGAGKTTLARAIFDKISFNFEGRSFVENVRENSLVSGLKKLQEQVLADVFKDNGVRVSSIHEGTNFLKTMLCGKKVLVVLDDVDHKDQLEVLAGDPSWFKAGSRIIITTRDEQVLIAHRVKWIHDVNLLSDEEAICLFRIHAFTDDIPRQEYEMQSLEVVRYAAGLPLTIKVLGSFLCGQDKSVWIDALARLKMIPLKETLEKLKLSYESLDDDYKEIFLDVVCYDRFRMLPDVIQMLESCGFHARNGLRVLQQKSLITIKLSVIFIHDHIEEMGKYIVSHKPQRQSRLWVQEDIKHILANDLGSETTRCITLEITPWINLEGLGNMKKLRRLTVRKFNRFAHNLVINNESCRYFPNSLQHIDWKYYPHWCLPRTFEANNLVSLEMSHSNIKQLWEGGKVMKKLKFLNLSFSKLMSLDLGLTPNLERLDLEHCDDLVKLYAHDGKVMKKLKFIYLSFTKLRSLDLGLTPNLDHLKLFHCHDFVKLYVHNGCVQSLTYLNLSGCQNLKSLLFMEQLGSLVLLNLDALNLTQIPSSIRNLHKLITLYLPNNYNLKNLPGSICSLQCLRTLDLRHTGIEELPEDVGQLECLEQLHLTSTNVKRLPESICMMKHLENLLLERCNLLEKLPDDIVRLESLKRLNLLCCSNLKDLPNSIGKLKHLEELKLKGCSRLEKLPNDLGGLECLQILDIRDTRITDLPRSISFLQGLQIYKSKDDAFIQLCFKNEYVNPQIQGFQHLKVLNLGRCGIGELHEAIGHLDCLEELDVSYTDVRYLPNSICMLKSLKKLVLQRCVLLETLPHDVGCLESLEGLYLSRCYSIRGIPDSICRWKQLKILDLYHCFCLEKLPDDVGQLESLKELYLSRCYNIREIPNNICMLKHLEKLELEGCRRLEELPHELGDLECLKELDIRETAVTRLPWSISLLNGLKIYGFMYRH